MTKGPSDRPNKTPRRLLPDSGIHCGDKRAEWCGCRGRPGRGGRPFSLGPAVPRAPFSALFKMHASNIPAPSAPIVRFCATR